MNKKIDLRKYEGHTEGPWRTAEGQPYDDEGSHLDIEGANGVLVTETSYFTDNDHPNVQLIADAPLILQALIDERAEVKRLREALQIIKQDLDTAIAQGHIPIIHTATHGIDVTKIRNFANDASM